MKLIKYRYKCKEENCNNLIGYNSYHYGKGRCKKCSNLGERNPNYRSKKQCEKNHWNYKHGNNCKYKIYYCIEKGCKNKVCAGKNRCINHSNLVSANKRSISLCLWCHLKSNYNRKYWRKYYESRI